MICATFTDARLPRATIATFVKPDHFSGCDIWMQGELEYHWQPVAFFSQRYKDCYILEPVDVIP
jgi:hypothetical protein